MTKTLHHHHDRKHIYSRTSLEDHRGAHVMKWSLTEGMILRFQGMINVSVDIHNKKESVLTRGNGPQQIILKKGSTVPHFRRRLGTSSSPLLPCIPSRRPPRLRQPRHRPLELAQGRSRIGSTTALPPAGAPSAAVHVFRTEYSGGHEDFAQG